MKNNYDGFLVNYGSTGIQLGTSTACRATENRWEGSFNSHLFSYGSTGSSSHHHLSGSPMSTMISGGSMWPSPMISSAGGSGATAITYAGCGTPSGYKMAQPLVSEDFVKVIQNGLTYPVYQEAAEWMNKNALYQMIKSDESLALSAELNGFAKEIEGTNIAKLNEVNAILAGTSTARSASEVLAEIQPSNKIEEHLKDVYLITNALQEQQALTPAAIAKLKEIAALCPYESGPAVYNARVILSLADATTYHNSCEEVSTGKQAPALSLPASDKDLLILPNPNNGSFTLNFRGQQIQDVTVFDCTGKTVYFRKDVQASQLNVNISELPQGLYIVKLTSAGVSYSRKVIKE
jgi:hypothetical protein